MLRERESPNTLKCTQKTIDLLVKIITIQLHTAHAGMLNKNTGVPS